MKNFSDTKSFISFILLIVISFSFSTAHSAANIGSIDISQIDNNILVINGSGFGSGPTVNIFDEFSNGTTSNVIPNTSPQIGLWEPFASTNVQPTYDNISHSGNHSARAFDNDMKIFRYIFSSGITEVFVSYWIRIPDNTPFPGMDGGIKSFSSDSSWKFTWLYDESHSGADSDICLPTYTGSGVLQHAGNDMNLIRLNHNLWWDWDNWMRISVWLKANEADPTTPGVVQTQTVSSGKGMYITTNYDRAIFDTDGPDLKQYRHFNIPGWIRSTSSPNTRVLYDDIYVASGRNAVSRVEIGNQSTYDNSTMLAIQEVTSWSDNQITLRLRNGGFTDIKTGYIYLTDADGNANSAGITILDRPSAPTDISITVGTN